MASLVARTAYTVPESWSNVVAGIWRSVGGSLLSSVLQYRSYSDEGLDVRVPPNPGASSAADPVVDTPLSGDFPPAGPKKFGADTPVYDRNACPPKKWEGFRAYQTPRGAPIAILKPQLTRTALNEEESSIDKFLRASQELCHETPRQGLVSIKQRPIDSALPNIHMPSTRTKSEALAILKNCQQQGITINSYTLVHVLKRCSEQKDLIAARQVHDYIIQSGMDQEPHVANTLLNVYIKCERLEDARRVFDGLEKKTVVTWNVLIGAYAASGRIDDARLVFDRMENRMVSSWNRMISAYTELGCGVEAYQLFRQMKREGFVPNAITYMSILNAAASGGALKWVKEVHGHALKAGLELDVRVGTALVQMYAKSGSIDDARLIFDRMKKRNVVTWNTMIGGLAQHGCAHEALELFRLMNAQCVKPSESTFVAVLSACCHAGLVDDGRRHFLAMMHDYGIEPTVIHCNCIVDLLGRAGHLEEAKLFIGDMPVEPDGVTWQALLGACKIYGNVELGELAAIELLKLEPKKASAYVLLSNIYAAAGQWEKRSLVRTMMQERGVMKDPGLSRIEVDNKIHEFIVGDMSHPESKAIYSELKKLTEKLKAEGYIPDTKLMLQNTDEEDKELVLWSHSEKLAIAYGLLRIPRGQPIRIFKNLRVCSDCHTATKFISKVTGREIIARDANRFHHFKDGVCSCGDYW